MRNFYTQHLFGMRLMMYTEKEKMKKGKRIEYKKDNDQRIKSNVFYSFKSNQHNLCSHHQKKMGNM